VAVVVDEVWAQGADKVAVLEGEGEGEVEVGRAVGGRVVRQVAEVVQVDEALAGLGVGRAEDPVALGAAAGPRPEARHQRRRRLLLQPPRLLQQQPWRRSRPTPIGAIAGRMQPASLALATL
jgi:hypothetical protein